MKTPLRTVVCDDAPDFRALLRVLLESHTGLEIVAEAEHGELAVEACRRIRPELLVLDVSMPVMDGLTALPLVQAASPETCIVMLTGLSDPRIHAEARARGAATVLEKGVETLEIPERLVAAYNANNPAE